MTRDVLVMRHGQTAFNAQGRMQGQLDVPLDAEGHRQARDVAAALVGHGIARLLSSDLSRASATAATIGRALGLPVLLDARLREQHYGSWQGRTEAEIRTAWPEQHAAWARGNGDPVGGEPLDAVGARALEAVAELRPPTGALLVVTHGDTARALCGRLAGVPASDVPPLRNTEIRRIRESIRA